MLSKAILDNLWQSGFCRTHIELLRGTTPGSAGTSDRLAITSAHLDTGCVDCTHATTMRDVEYRTAMAMGGEAPTIYNRGGDIRRLPGFQSAFKRVFDAGVATGHLGPALAAWMQRIVPERAGQPYPDTEDDDATKAN